MSHRAQPRQALAHAGRGFVLPVTVMLLALISVGVALMSHRSDQLRSLVTLSRQEQQAAVAAHNALAEALYLSSTMVRRGSRLGDIEIDGRFYRDAEGSYVRYQDAGALFNLRRARTSEIVGLLRALGVADDKTSMLADTLADYVDADSLVRVNGAEAPEYRAAGLPAPRNAPLLMPDELQRIAGWRELDPALMRKVLDQVYVGNVNAVNRYTVTAPALAAISGADVEAARELVAQRAPGTQVAIESLPNIARGSFLSASRYITLPSATLFFTVCPARVAWCQHTSLTASADEGETPWHVDYSVRRMRITPLPAPARVAPLPNQPPKLAQPPLMTPFGLFQ